MQTTVDISPRSFFTAVALGLLAWLCWEVRDVVILLMFAVVLSAALHPPLAWLERRGIPRPFGMLGLYVLIIGVVSIIVITFAPLVIVQSRQLLVALANEIIKLGGDGNATVVNALITGFTNLIKVISTNAFSTLITASGVILLIVLLGLLVYYLTVDHGNFRRFIASLTPMRYRQALLEEGNAVEHRLSLWLRGQLTLGLVIAVMTAIGLLALRVPYVLPLALIAGIGEMIPMVGPYIAMVPAAAIGFSISPYLGVSVILLYYLIQQVENNFLTPKIVSHAVGLSPLVVLVALLIGASAFGFVGLLLAIPMVILVQSAYAVWKKVRFVSSATPHD